MTPALGDAARWPRGGKQKKAFCLERRVEMCTGKRGVPQEATRRTWSLGQAAPEPCLYPRPSHQLPLESYKVPRSFRQSPFRLQWVGVRSPPLTSLGGKGRWEQAP